MEGTDSDFNFGTAEEEKNTLEHTPPLKAMVPEGPFKEATEDVFEEMQVLIDHLTSKYNSFKKFVG